MEKVAKEIMKELKEVGLEARYAPECHVIETKWCTVLIRRNKIRVNDQEFELSEANEAVDMIMGVEGY